MKHIIIIILYISSMLLIGCIDSTIKSSDVNIIVNQDNHISYEKNFINSINHLYPYRNNLEYLQIDINFVETIFLFRIKTNSETVIGSMTGNIKQSTWISKNGSAQQVDDKLTANTYIVELDDGYTLSFGYINNKKIEKIELLSDNDIYVPNMNKPFFWKILPPDGIINKEKNIYKRIQIRSYKYRDIDNNIIK